MSNAWKHKPWWCQPWSILLTGCLLIGGSYGILGLSFWWLIVATPVAVWMGYFLIVWPRAVQRYLDERSRPQ